MKTLLKSLTFALSVGLLIAFSSPAFAQSSEENDWSFTAEFLEKCPLVPSKSGFKKVTCADGQKLGVCHMHTDECNFISFAANCSATKNNDCDIEACKKEIQTYAKCWENKESSANCAEIMKAFERIDKCTDFADQAAKQLQGKKSGQGQPKKGMN